MQERPPPPLPPSLLRSYGGTGRGFGGTRRRVSLPRFWGLLIALLFANLPITRIFGWVVRTLDLGNSTRPLYRG